MNLQLTGHHVEITPAIRDYVVAKLERINRHFDHVIDVNVVMTVEKLDQKIEANVHLSGKDIHVRVPRGGHVRGDRRPHGQARPPDREAQGKIQGEPASTTRAASSRSAKADRPPVKAPQRSA